MGENDKAPMKDKNLPGSLIREYFENSFSQLPQED
jgi:hypothetical protein